MSQDGVVALGGLLQAATETYRASEEKRVEEVKRLREELKEQVEAQKKMRTEMEQQMKDEKEQMSQQIQAIRSLIQNKALLKFSLRDLAGVWFDTTSSCRVRVAQDGTCVSDDGTTRTVSVSGDDVILDGGFTLSVSNSSRKLLVWEKAGASPVHWEYEMPGGSRQVTLTLDVTHVIVGQEVYEDGRRVAKQDYSFKFSLIGCEVNLTLSRNAEVGSAKAGDKYLGVYFGLLKSSVKVGDSPNSVDAINCRAQVEIWDPKARNWLFLVRTTIRRFLADGDATGHHTSVTLARLKELAAPQPQHNVIVCGNNSRNVYGKFRITITDIGLLELSRTQAIVPR